MGTINAMRLTEYFNSEDECQDWFEWLKNRSIPVAIIVEGGNYAVWRQGSVQRKTVSKGGPDYYRIQCGPEKIKSDHRIIESANGFNDTAEKIAGASSFDPPLRPEGRGGIK